MLKNWLMYEYMLAVAVWLFAGGAAIFKCVRGRWRPTPPHARAIERSGRSAMVDVSNLPVWLKTNGENWVAATGRAPYLCFIAESEAAVQEVAARALQFYEDTADEREAFNKERQMETPAEIIARQIGYENVEQHALALAAAGMYLAALTRAGYEIIRTADKPTIAETSSSLASDET